jgi:hypothetical protein
MSAFGGKADIGHLGSVATTHGRFGAGSRAFDCFANPFGTSFPLTPNVTVELVGMPYIVGVFMEYINAWI